MGASNSKGDAERVNKKDVKESSISSSDRVKLQLKIQRDGLRAAMNKYERVGRLEHEKAKEMLKLGDKRKALYCLKREKIQGERITQLVAMYENIDLLLGTIENKEVELQVFGSLKTGKEELARLNNMLKVEDIEKLMAETEESIEQAQEINAILSQPLETTVFDEEELLSELLEETGDTEMEKLKKYTVPSSKINAPAVRVEEHDHTILERV